MSLRWPLKGTRGFSATPRRGSKSITVAQTPKPSRSFARRVVKAAGPQEKAFFTNSTLVEAGTRPNTFVNAAVRESQNRFRIFTPSDWAGQIGSRERLLIRRMDVVVHMYALAGSSELPMDANIFGCLLRGTNDDINENVLSTVQWPFGYQSAVLGFQDINPKVVSFMARKNFHMWLPGIRYTDPGSDINTTALVSMQSPGPTIRRVKFTIRNKWLREPEEINLLFTHLKYGMDQTENVNTSGAVIGWIETYCRYARY